MNKIVLMPVTTVCHTSCAVRPLSYLLAFEFVHASYDGILGLLVFYFAKIGLMLLLAGTERSGLLSSHCFLDLKSCKVI